MRSTDRTDGRSSPPAVKFAVCIGATARSQAYMAINRDGASTSAMPWHLRNGWLHAFGADDPDHLRRRQKPDKVARCCVIRRPRGKSGGIRNEVAEFRRQRPDQMRPRYRL